MDMLVSKYENRIKNFVFQMAEKPIVVKKVKEKLFTNREALLAETSDKILSKKGFVFTSYKTDKERIKEHLEREARINNSNKYATYNTESSNMFQSKFNLIQPSMRFKPRTDLERVYDTLKQREVIDTDRINKHLNRNVFSTQNLNDSYDSDEDNLNTNYILTKKKILNQEEEYRRRMHNKIIEDRKEMIKMRKMYLTLQSNKKKLENAEFRNVRADLHNKTHFKAMENLTMFKTSTMNHNLFKSFSKEDIERQKQYQETKNNFYQTVTMNSFYPQRQRFNNTSNTFKSLPKKPANMSLSALNTVNPQKSNFTLIGNAKILKDLEITKEIANSNPLLFNMNFNSIKADTGTFNVTNEQLDSLRKIAFEKNPSEEELSTKDIKELIKGNNDFDEYKKDQNIVIDGQEFKRTELDKIADTVLKKCNWNEKKKKYSNKGQGKLMFTNGLTLSEFEMKYGLLP